MFNMQNDEQSAVMNLEEVVHICVLERQMQEPF